MPATKDLQTKKVEKDKSIEARVTPDTENGATRTLRKLGTLGTGERSLANNDDNEKNKTKTESDFEHRPAQNVSKGCTKAKDKKR